MLGSGPTLTVSLVERAPSTVEVTITTGRGFALTGWGRGDTAANRLLRALVAQTGQRPPDHQSRANARQSVRHPDPPGE